MSRNKLAVSMAVPEATPPTTGMMPPAPLKPPQPHPAIAPPTPQLKAPAYKPYVPKPVAKPEPDWRSAARAQMLEVQNRVAPTPTAANTAAMGPRPFVRPTVAPTTDTPEYAAHKAAIPGMSVMGTHGAAVDPKDPTIEKFWAEQQIEKARRRHYGVPPHLIEQQFNPEEVARSYITDRAATRRDETEADARGTGLMGAYQRFRGFKRPDPNTGKYVTTTDENIGKDPNGRASAWWTTAGAVPMSVASTLTLPVQAATGDYAPIAGSLRSLMAGPNHETNSDIGWNLKPDAKMQTPWSATPELQDAFTGADAQTTPNIFGSPVYDPLSRTYKPSVADAAANQAQVFADDNTNPAGQVDKGVAGMTAAGLRNARNLYGAATAGRFMGGHGAPAMLSGVAGGSAALGALNLTDPTKGETVKDRVIPALQDAYTGTMSQFSANPLFSGTTELLDRSGVQDSANAAGNYIRGLAADDAGTVPKLLANTAAGTVEAAPSMLPMLIRRDPQALSNGLNGIKNFATKGIKDVGMYAGIGGAGRGVHDTLTSSDGSTPSPESVLQQRDAGAADMLGAMQQFRQNNNLPANAELDQQVAKRAPEFNPLDVLPTGAAVQEYATNNPEIAAKMQESAQKTVTTAASTPEGKQELASLQQTGDLSPGANETVKYNLISDGFDADKVGDWYNQLGGPEKFALWGGVSMTMLGLMHAMNGGGVGGVLAAILGLGTVGATAGQSGLFGDGVQQQTQQITKPISSAVGGGIQSIVGRALQNPTAIKALAPVLDSLPDDSIVSLQQQLRQHAPDAAAKLDGVTGGWQSWVPGSHDMAIQQLTTDYGFSPTAAEKWLTLWPQSK